ncbi:MAG TPA: beta-glucosidase [Candidimonas sp.]|nr:beta-glucosidase [Candidimonas sp.]
MTQLFNSFFLGGFECSTHRRRDGRRLDLIKTTHHDAFALRDYQALRSYGIATVRDGLRWHLIEPSPGQYDWSSFLDMLRAARQADMQPIWDLCHYGWPDDIDIWSPQFVKRFADFAARVAAIVRDEWPGIAYYCPINEISFWAWAGGDMALFNPLATRRGMELKTQLVRASLAAVVAIRQVAPLARIVHIDPVINVVPKSPRSRRQAEHAQQAQFEAWDMLAGAVHPQLGGGTSHLDIIGVNYYSNNQWVLGGRTVKRDSPLYRPLRDILADTYHRYRRPIFIAETGAEGEHRAPWFRYVCDEAYAALKEGVPLGGICLYPITDYPGWANNRHCQSGLLGRPDKHGDRPVHTDLANELSIQQQRFQQFFSPTTALDQPLTHQDPCRAAVE